METNELYTRGTYDLVEPMDGNGFLLYKNQKKILQGTLKEVIAVMVQQHGFDIVEIETAVEEMLKNDHDRANFGVNRTFIFSTNEPINPKDFVAA